MLFRAEHGSWGMRGSRTSGREKRSKKNCATIISTLENEEAA